MKTLCITIVKMLVVGIACFEISLYAKASEDKIYLEETVISGNQELPKVLYILPWQAASDAVVPERQFTLENQNFLHPIYPAEFKRELAYRARLNRVRSNSDNSSTQQTLEN